jgi:cytochrome c553
VTPLLAGQDSQYLITAIRTNNEGLRKHAVMQTAVAALSVKDIESLAAYQMRFYKLLPKIAK